MQKSGSGNLDHQANEGQDFGFGGSDSVACSQWKLWIGCCLQPDSQDWESASGVARAFSIGPKESQAVCALINAVPESIRNRLENAVKIRGMQRFLNHDVVGKGTFSVGFSSASGPTESWHDELTNRKDAHDLAA